MAANITFTSQDDKLGPYPLGGKIRERVKAVGASSAAGDTGTCQLNHIISGARVINGAFEVTAETVARGKGASLALKAIGALNSQTVYFEVEGNGF